MFSKKLISVYTK